ncbi:MAG: hypothetical protein HYW86_02235 [Candidatus Roizmanbacteria bacterium]|nr:MAG: hypothetical protein HYW86_02235 [Candidatus Roizmanbacteria bacterium]
MRHQLRKIKIQKGYDANKMLVRKLIVNFLKVGRITTTEKKAKILKPIIEKIVEKSKARTESNKNHLLKKLANPKLVELLFLNVGKAFEERVGGYVKIEKLSERESDGALMVRLIWSSPVVFEGQNKEIIKKNPVKSEKLK